MKINFFYFLVEKCTFVPGKLNNYEYQDSRVCNQ
jgi:hypothetical protein